MRQLLVSLRVSPKHLGTRIWNLKNSDFQSHATELKNQKEENLVGIIGVKEVKAPWVNLFNDNRKMEENIKLKAFDNQSEEVVLGESDEDNIENTWGYGLVGGWLVFKFEKDSERLSVLHGGPYLVYGRPLMLKVMPSYFDFDDKDVSTLPIWINLLGLPLEFWNTSALGKIVSKVGKPISTDKVTTTRGRLSYARALVEVDASIELVRCLGIPLLGCNYNKHVVGNKRKFVNGEVSKASMTVAQEKNTWAGKTCIASNVQRSLVNTATQSHEIPTTNDGQQTSEINSQQR
ncbi:uncharacterized protein LOC111397618 [Olea europaea var. sylvestris]|uniref:uncharacterized protein LOC111397618 n=1 Tax=Olea europaea var. sylvestris TaxID=158386 RepID=UPI000C1D684D|nr:uncharacterized protein LOC111397618 [Olea europaea var. sylvestris]